MATATKRQPTPKGKSAAKAAPKKRAATARSTARKPENYRTGGKKRRIKIWDEDSQLAAIVTYDDATQRIELSKKLVDIWKGIPGDDSRCMDAQCIVRSARENKKLFPHKVLAASVIKSRVYILDSHDHAWRYLLSRSESQRIAVHDEDKIAQPGTLTLYPPTPSKAAGTTHISQHKPHDGKRNGQNKKGITRGAAARLAAAVGADD